MEPQIALTGFHSAKITSAMASQPLSPNPLLVQVPPEYSMTKYSPPSPLIPPPTQVARYLYAVTLMPAASAVAGLSPTALRFSPFLVLPRKKARTIARMIAR